MKLIGITGRKGSGKDTAASPLTEDDVFKVVKFAGPLKNMLRSLLSDAGLDDGTIERCIEGDLKEVPCEALQGKTPRYAMQTLGTEWRDFIGKDLWTDIIDMRLKAYARGGAHGVVISDLRFPHEHAYLVKVGAKKLRIIGRAKQNESSEHISEKFIDEMEVDGEIFNFGTIQDLQDALLRLSEDVRGCNI